MPSTERRSGILGDVKNEDSVDGTEDRLVPEENAMGMNWTWFALGIYGLIGISRFAWAMRRKATWDKNIWAQETIRNLSPVALLVTVLFEVFLWPVELAICFYLISMEKRKKRLGRRQ